MKEEERKKILQQKLIELQLLEQHMNEIYQQLQILTQKSQELENLSESLSYLKDLKDKKESYSQLGSGIFLKTELKETESVLMDVGASIAVKKPVGEAKEILEIQLKEISNSIKMLEQQLQKAAVQAYSHQEELQKIQSTSQK